MNETIKQIKFLPEDKTYDIQANVTRKTASSSGNPVVTFDDGASAPLVKCVTEIQGSQDLHGYDKPWVGGAGKNKYGNGDKTFVQAMQNIVLDTPLPAGTYTFSAIVTSTDTDNDDCLIQFVSGSAIAASGRIWRSTSNNRVSLSFTWSEGTVDKLNLYAAASYVNGAGDTATYTDIQIESGSTATSYEPYSNICPITAYTEGEIEVRGKNLFDISTAISGYIDENGNVITYTNFMASDFMRVNANMAYNLSFYRNITSGGNGMRIAWYDNDKVFIRRDGTLETTTVGLKSYSAVAPSNASYARVSMVSLDSSDFQFEKGETATDYEPYTSTTHSTTYPSAIYRGSEDVVNGTETHDMVKVVFDGSNDEDWRANSYYPTQFAVSVNDYNIKLFSSAYAEFAISNMYDKHDVSASQRENGRMTIYNGTWSGTNGIWLAVRDDRFTTLADFKAAIATTPIELAYKMETPTTSSVTPTNLPIKSLNGYTHIESSTGDMEIEYITQEYQPLVDLIGDAITTPILDYDNAVDLTLPDATGYTYIMPSDGVIMSTSYGSVGSTRIIYNGIEISQAYMGDSWTTQYTPFGRGTEITIKRGAAEIQYVSGSWIKFIPYKNGAGGSTLQTTTPTRSLNLTKSAVEEIPEEIKNAEYEEKPDVNEADDSAPTEVDER